jgi:ubiquinone/menaquinone biosynthesis C-methylase UbiE
MYAETETEQASVEGIKADSILLYPETADIETASEAYAKRFRGEVGAWFLMVQEEALLNMIKPYSHARILDIGGGHGQVAGVLIQHKHKVTVFGSAEKCQIKLQKYIKEGVCDFRVGNILDLPYPDCYFDVVVSFRLLPHVKRWKPFLSEAARVAKKAVIVDYPELHSINFFAPPFFNLKKRLEKNVLTRPYSCFKEKELEELLNQNGFIRKERYAEFFLPMVFHRVLNSPKISSELENIFRSMGLTEKFGSPAILKLVREEFHSKER